MKITKFGWPNFDPLNEQMHIGVQKTRIKMERQFFKIRVMCCQAAMCVKILVSLETHQRRSVPDLVSDNPLEGQPWTLAHQWSLAVSFSRSG